MSHLLVAVVAIAAVLAIPSAPVGLAVGGAALGGLRLAGVPMRGVARGLAGPAWLVAVAIGLKLLAGGKGALPEAALLGSRVVGASLVMRWLVATSTPAALAAALVRLGVPRDFVEVLALAARYADLLRQDGARLVAAAKVRLGFRSTRTVARVAPAIAGSIVLRATERAEAVARVLALRGYRGELPLGESARGAS